MFGRRSEVTGENLGRSPAVQRIASVETRLSQGQKLPLCVSVGRLTTETVEAIRQYFIKQGLAATTSTPRPPRRGRHHRRATLVISRCN